MLNEKKLFLFGLSIIIFIIYRTIFLIRIPYSLDETVPALVLLLICIIVTTQIYILIQLINELRNKNKSSKLKKYLSYIMERFYFKPLCIVGHQVVKYKIVILQIKEWAGVLEILILNKLAVYIISILFFIMPKLLLGISLLADVLILKKICVFYHMLYLILIPLMYQVALALIKIYFTEKLNYINENFIMVRENNILLPKVNMNEHTFNIYVHNWTYYNNIIDIATASHLVLKTKPILRLNILVSLLYIIAWSCYIYSVLYAYAIMNQEFFDKYITSLFALWIYYLILKL